MATLLRTRRRFIQADYHNRLDFSQYRMEDTTSTNKTHRRIFYNNSLFFATIFTKEFIVLYSGTSATSSLKQTHYNTHFSSSPTDPSINLKTFIFNIKFYHCPASNPWRLIDASTAKNENTSVPSYHKRHQRQNTNSLPYTNSTSHFLITRHINFAPTKSELLRKWSKPSELPAKKKIDWILESDVSYRCKRKPSNFPLPRKKRTNGPAESCRASERTLQRTSQETSGTFSIWSVSAQEPGAIKNENGPSISVEGTREINFAAVSPWGRGFAQRNPSDEAPRS